MDLCHGQPTANKKIFVSNPSKTSTGKAFVMKSESSMTLAQTMPGVPGRLRVADLNSDGYPEIVATT